MVNKKIIKTTGLLLLLLFPILLQSQSNWAHVTIPYCGYSFKMPAKPTKQDTLNFVHYFYTEDSTISMQVQYLYNLPANLNQPPQQELGNTFEFYCKSLIYISKGKLIHYETKDIERASLTGGEVGVAVGDEDKLYLFSQMYFGQNEMITFIIEGNASRIDDILRYKRIFFSSFETNGVNPGK